MNVLILTASYGAGHNSAAAALGEEFTRCRIPVQVLDGLALDSSISYPLTRNYYQFCVNHAGWLWGLTFEATDKADWSRLVQTRFFKSCVDALAHRINDGGIDFVISTYPLFCFMLDEIKARYGYAFQHVAVVTDAIEVSRPWVRSGAECIFVTDEYSASIISARYALSEALTQVQSFPTSARFYPAPSLTHPSETDLRLLYSAQAPAAQCAAELKSLIQAYPDAGITVLAGKRFAYLQKALGDFASSPRVQVLARSDAMDALMREHHLYVGKPGGATMFECYASALPMIVNFALMGQEQGNLELLQRDECGCFARGADALLDAVAQLLAHQAQVWKSMRAQMLRLPRRNGAARIRQACELIHQSAHDCITG